MILNYKKNLSFYSLLRLTGLGVMTLSSAISYYLPFFQTDQSCVFCTVIRFLITALTGLYYWSVLFKPPFVVYALKLSLSFFGFLLSLRQFFSQKALATLAVCATPKSLHLKEVMYWLGAGAPACHKSPVLGWFNLASWALILFTLLCVLVAAEFYYTRRNKQT